MKFGCTCPVGTAYLMVPMMIVANDSTTRGTNMPLTGSLMRRRACLGYTAQQKLLQALLTTRAESYSPASCIVSVVTFRTKRAMFKK